MSNPDVLIIGAGPTGLVTALWLVKQGISIRIVDKTNVDVTTSRALATQARTLELYRQLDIAEDVITRGHKIRATNVWSEGTHRGRIPIGDLGDSLTPYPFIYILSQDRHEKLLEERYGMYFNTSSMIRLTVVAARKDSRVLSDLEQRREKLLEIQTELEQLKKSAVSFSVRVHAHWNTTDAPSAPF